jgi:hypothetical protein
MIERTGFYKGFQWVVTANPRGFRCGYVVISEGHELHKKDYFDININCHGGLTFGDEFHWVENTWAIGFDCNHSYDAMDESIMSYELKLAREEHSELYEDHPYSEVRGFEYVRSECLSIIDQITEMEDLKDETD